MPARSALGRLECRECQHSFSTHYSEEVAMACLREVSMFLRSDSQKWNVNFNPKSIEA